uniref:Nucleotid_trans domain-containing protein n=1 Tax=Parastrongyloides trichosuri TaxID=131310 RepID=A0A0N4Z1F7_PARTI
MNRHIKFKKVFILLISTIFLSTLIYLHFNSISYLDKSPLWIRPSISILMVVDNNDIQNYDIALKTVKCYAAHYKYNYSLLNINYHRKLTKNCKQRDFMYKRHCFLANYLKHNFEDGDIILFLDADIGVINPNHILEKYIPIGNEEIIFYERIFNHEIAAGTFFIKNSNYSRQFLINWSEYDFLHPYGRDGRDNVGLHFALLDYIPEKFSKIKLKCYEIWVHTKSYKDNNTFIPCTRYIMKESCNINNSSKETNNYFSFDNGKIKILKKLSPRKWARDVWLTNSYWSSNDFMLHGLKLNVINKNDAFNSWHQLLNITSYNFTQCYLDNYNDNWDYYHSYHVLDDYIKLLLMKKINQVSDNYYKLINKSEIESIDKLLSQ